MLLCRFVCWFCCGYVSDQYGFVQQVVQKLLFRQDQCQYGIIEQCQDVDIGDGVEIQIVFEYLCGGCDWQQLLGIVQDVVYECLGYFEFCVVCLDEMDVLGFYGQCLVVVGLEIDEIGCECVGQCGDQVGVVFQCVVLLDQW